MKAFDRALLFNEYETLQVNIDNIRRDLYHFSVQKVNLVKQEDASISDARSFGGRGAGRSQDALPFLLWLPDRNVVGLIRLVALDGQQRHVLRLLPLVPLGGAAAAETSGSSSGSGSP